MRRANLLYTTLSILLLSCSAPPPSKALISAPSIAQPEAPPNDDLKAPALTTTPAAATAPANDEASLLALGHEKFVEGCAGCHNERGDKPLPDGRILRDFEFTQDELVEKVGRRSHSYGPLEQKALAVYVASFLTHPPSITNESKAD